MRVTLLIARLTLKAALRARLSVAVAMTGSLLVALTWWLRGISFAAPELRFVLDCGFGVISLGGLALAIAGTVSLYFSDIESQWTDFVLSRPVDRHEYLLGKLGGMAGLLAVFSLAMAGMVAILLAWSAGPQGSLLLPWSEIVRGCALLWLKSLVATALTLMVCSFARTALFAQLVALMLVGAGHLRPVLGESGELSPRGALIGALRLLPDFQAFEPAAWTEASGGGLFGISAYGAALIGVYAFASVWFFKNREL